MVDERLEIGQFETPKMTKAEKKAANKAAAKMVEDEKENGKELPKKGEVTAAGVKRTAEIAQLDMPPDVARAMGPGSVTEQASGLAV